MGLKTPRKPRKPPTPKFKEDWRKENPALHLLYTKDAICILIVARQSMKRLGDFSNLHALDLAYALSDAHDRLIRDYAHYAEAHAILKSISDARKVKREFSKDRE